MPFITVPGRNDPDVELHYDDVGAGRPVGLLFWFMAGRSAAGLGRARCPRWSMQVIE